MSLGYKHIEYLPYKLYPHDLVNYDPVVKICKELIPLSSEFFIVEVDSRKLFVLEVVIVPNKIVSALGTVGVDNCEMGAIEKGHHYTASVSISFDLIPRQFHHHSGYFSEGLDHLEDDCLESRASEESLQMIEGIFGKLVAYYMFGNIVSYVIADI